MFEAHYFLPASTPILMLWLALLMILWKIDMSSEKEVLVLLMKVIFY